MRRFAAAVPRTAGAHTSSIRNHAGVSAIVGDGSCTYYLLSK